MNIAVHRSELEPAVYTGEVEVEKLKEFVKANSVPLVAELGPNNYMSYYKSKVPLLFTFVNVDAKEQLANIVTVLKAVGRKHMGQISMTYTNG